MNNFTEEEIKTAKDTKKVILEERIPELSAIYMAGEICMHEELKNVPIDFAVWILKKCNMVHDTWQYFKHPGISEHKTTLELYEIFKREGC